MSMGQFFSGSHSSCLRNPAGFSHPLNVPLKSHIAEPGVVTLTFNPALQEEAGGILITGTFIGIVYGTRPDPKSICTDVVFS